MKVSLDFWVGGSAAIEIQLRAAILKGMQEEEVEFLVGGSAAIEIQLRAAILKGMQEGEVEFLVGVAIRFHDKIHSFFAFLLFFAVSFVCLND